MTNIVYKSIANRFFHIMAGLLKLIAAFRLSRKMVTKKIEPENCSNCQIYR